MVETLVVVLNHTLVMEEGHLQPSHIGKLRAGMAVAVLAANPDFRQAISGGYDPDPEESGAAVISKYQRDELNYTPRGGDIVTCQSTNTVGNIVDLVDKLKHLGYDKTLKTVIFTVHPDQARQASITLGKLLPGVEVTCIPSGETHPYPKWVRNLLVWLTKRDPLWNKPWTLPLTIATRVRRFIKKPRK